MSDVIEMLLYLYAESPVHAGAADSNGVLDLPVQREATTNYPVIWGQSLKGALRQAAVDADWPSAAVTDVFGSEIDSGEDAPAERTARAGTLVVGDAQLVAIPVPTLRRTFAWVTSRLALSRLQRKQAAMPEPHNAELADVAVASDVGAAADDVWISKTQPPQAEVLGPFLVHLGPTGNQQLAAWAKRLAADAVGDDPIFAYTADKLRADLLLVGSDLMPDLLRECTEFLPRVHLGRDKVVEEGPFYSEYLPAETILAASLTLRPPSGENGTQRHSEHYDRLTRLLHGTLIQVGGDETVGKGLLWSRLVGGAS